MTQEDIKRTGKQLQVEAERAQPEFLDSRRRARVADAIANLESRLQGKNGSPSELETAASKQNRRISVFIKYLTRV